jgi:hypothetical protein
MQYPKFFDEIPSIILQDDLSKFLGAFDGGEVEFSYLDAVKIAGHSCPTVAGAYLSCLYGLYVLYGNNPPKRGEIIVEVKDDIKNGTTGVVGNIISAITGATSDYGFKGLNGKFSRNNLMFYNANIESSLRFSKLNKNHFVQIDYNPNKIPPNPAIKILMEKVMKGTARRDETINFKQLWQKRVEQILKNPGKVISIKTNLA